MLTAYVEMFLLCERLVTQRALEGADPGVEQHVTLQVPTIIKHLAALLARQSRCAAVRADTQVLAQTQLTLVDLAVDKDPTHPEFQNCGGASHQRGRWTTNTSVASNLSASAAISDGVLPFCALNRCSVWT